MLGLLLAVVIAVPAAAAKPERAFVEAPPPTDYAAEVFCAFPVRIEAVTNQEYGITFAVAEDGTQRSIVTGRLVVVITNLDTQESLTVNASGPGVFTFGADGLTIDGGGNWLFYLFATDAGGPGIWVASGRVHLEAGASGVTALAMPHRTQDVCELLAA
ncbi:MAG TPA: hypothetical protein VEW95_04710 [Candidatus Limnocylindrales bacterium]|nr:hypothetical protein [Candidatus Limnocylindrales bacterium]